VHDTVDALFTAVAEDAEVNARTPLFSALVGVHHALDERSPFIAGLLDPSLSDWASGE